jgi:hypothetical protein
MAQDYAWIVKDLTVAAFFGDDALTSREEAAVTHFFVAKRLSSAGVICRKVLSLFLDF